ncbi:hypothetical protein A2U01_0005048 [Trifolium medium]|uniref:Uncharacterized protein n=1 Tax=Trifolium medium TaxID=97028 RepID=A0A392M9N5_9FABA|nr:hypothetical protein [Trifolium medium]
MGQPNTPEWQRKRTTRNPENKFPASQSASPRMQPRKPGKTSRKEAEREEPSPPPRTPDQSVRRLVSPPSAEHINSEIPPSNVNRHIISDTQHKEKRR